MSGFNRAVAVTLGQEGGLSDHADDRGGRTNYGVTEAVWLDWLKDRGQEVRPVDEVTVEEARAIYHERYWLAARCDAFPWPLSLVLFDCAVNHGVVNGIKLIQRALGVADDGVVGPVTIGAASSANATTQAEDMLWERAEEYAKIVRANRSQASFIVGWTRRMRHLRDVVLGRPAA